MSKDNVSKLKKKRKKEKVLGEVEVLGREEYEGLELDARIEVIKALIPLGLQKVEEELKREVEHLAGEKYDREAGGKAHVRYGSNPGSVRLAGHRIGIRVPRVRNQHTHEEVPLESYHRFKEESGEVHERLLARVLYGISTRNYEAAAREVPEAIGLSASTVSRRFIEATAEKLEEFQTRDLSEHDIVAVWIDGKTFAEDTMIIAMGLTSDGRKVLLGFVQSGTENALVIGNFLEELIERGLRIEKGVLVIIDGSKGIRKAVRQVFNNKAVVQRCQWHKRENVVSYLPKNEQASLRRRLQRAYEQPTYQEAEVALAEIKEELEERNRSAARSLEEGLEETLTLHRLGVFEFLGHSLKTTNCIESIMSLIERRCGRVSRWSNSSQKERWLATSLLDIEPRLRRIRGYKHISILREALQEELGIKEEEVTAC